MATRIYPEFSSDINFGERRGSLELDYIHVSEASEYDKLDLCIEGKDSQKDSFIAMTLTVSDAEVLIKLLREKVFECKKNIVANL